MNIIDRFYRLKLWGKLGAIGSIASIIGFLIAIISIYYSDERVSVSIDNQGTYVGNARDVEINYNLGQQSGNSNKTVNVESALKKILPDGIRSKSFRYAESLLGVPIEDYGKTRVYEYGNYRIKLFGGSDVNYSSIEYGPLFGLKEKSILGLFIPHKRVNISFPNLTIGALVERFNHCYVSDWNYGAMGQCMNYFEVECGGGQVDSGLYYRVGINSCLYNMEHIEQESLKALLYFPEVQEESALENKKVNEAKANFVTVSENKRDCPRGSGCE